MSNKRKDKDKSGRPDTGLNAGEQPLRRGALGWCIRLAPGYRVKRYYVALNPKCCGVASKGAVL